ncbi:MAG: tetratricopeptide repeat protein, partial [Candidatus Eisenbacteria bacterium]|nr:tetratricopeptide repeat protein [Candidatus Eisenbacteria bacterium]
RVLVPVAVVALASLCGCVYYNTFYHAKAAAREAEVLREERPPGTEPTVREAELLERAIEKSGRILKLHPDSDWADDALLLMGESLYHKGQYEVAEERLNSFLTLYPESDLRREAEYTLAAAMMAGGNAVSAEDLLTDIAYTAEPDELSDDALVMVGRARSERGRYAEAAEAYEELIDNFPGSDRRAEARFRAAENYSKMGRLEEAVEQYAAVSEESGGRELLFEARLRLSETYLSLSDPETALQFIEDLEGRTVDEENLDKVLLLKGRAKSEGGDFESAISTYEGIAASRERTAAAAEAYYRIGLIHRDERGDFDAAQEAFEKSRSQAPRSDAARLAESAKRDLESLQRYLSVIEEHESSESGEAVSPRVDGVEPGDSASPGTTGVAPAPAETLSARSASPGTTGVAPAPAETLAARSASPGTTGVAPAPAETLARSEPAPGDTAGPTRRDTTAVADRAAGETPAPETTASSADTSGATGVSEVAEARFRVAELYLFELQKPETALGYYDAVIANHGESALAPKAALARAWLIFNRLEDPESARDAYEFVVERFPGTDYAREAQDVLDELSGGAATAEDAMEAD